MRPVRKLNRPSVVFDTTIFSTAEEVGQYLAQVIAAEIKTAGKKPYVLGLMADSNAKTICGQLVALFNAGSLSFQTVTVVMLNEFWPIDPADEHSHSYFIRHHLTSQVDIPPANVLVPPANHDSTQIASWATSFDQKLSQLGGFSRVILGPCRPGSTVEDNTGLIELDSCTRADASPDFFGMEAVPTKGLTVGAKHIKSAQRITVVGTREGAACSMFQLLEAQRTANPQLLISLLHEHPGIDFVLDEPAAAELSQVKFPYRNNPGFDFENNPQLLVRAVVAAAERAGVTVDSLDADHFRNEGLPPSLLPTMVAKTKAWFAARIIDPATANRSAQKTTSIEPHPDDTVIQVGGLVQHLFGLGHSLSFATCVSGNIAVWDSFAKQWADSIETLQTVFPDAGRGLRDIRNRILAALNGKKPGELDIPEVLALKGAIRRSETVGGIIAMGGSWQQAAFLNLPFYESGQIVKNKPGADDINVMARYLQRVEPQRILAAGDLTDPHGTHATCLQVLLDALKQLRDEGQSWTNDLELMLYRGAWQEWPLEEMDEIWLMTPEQLEVKMTAIKEHKSQVPKAMFPGSDPRSFDERARQRNVRTYERLKALGVLPSGNFAAAEGLVRYRF